MTIKEILMKAAQRPRDFGWVKGNYTRANPEDPKNCFMCAKAAIQFAAGSRATNGAQLYGEAQYQAERACLALAKHVGATTVPQWNDALPADSGDKVANTIETFAHTLPDA